MSTFKNLLVVAVLMSSLVATPALAQTFQDSMTAATQKFNEGQYDEARAGLQEALKLAASDIERSEALQKIAQSHMLQDKPALARVELAKILEMEELDLFQKAN